MIQENKELLLKDLCERLPFEVKAHFVSDDGEWDDIIDSIDIQYLSEKVYILFNRAIYFNKTDIKPYLRPMASMTEEEWNEYGDACDNAFSFTEEGRAYSNGKDVDWLIAHHFDFRNLIGRGLALEVTEENNPYK